MMIITRSLRPRLVGLVLMSLVTGLAWGAGEKERLPIGQFVAAKTAQAPVMDGKITDGEWDRALVSSGMMTPFNHDLQLAKTTIGFTFDEKRFYFLFDCVRGDREWKLWKSVRENDGYSFGDPSIEIWITPPALVPETYQNVINTYPAVLDNKMIPTRGYTAQGWRGNWDLGVSETDDRYILEASIPVSDIDGFDKVTFGEVWRFLLCRTSPGTLSRPQASWSITQGFSELGQHPQVQLLEDTPVLQVRNISSLSSAQPNVDIAIVGAAAKASEVDVEVRWHKAPVPGADDQVDTRRIKVAKGGRESFQVKTPRPAEEKGNFAITASVGGTVIFKQAWPYVVNGWTPAKPARPENAREAEELDLMVKYGPVHNVLILRADILDLPTRDQVAGGTVKVIDAATEKVLVEEPLAPFVESYSNVHFSLGNVKVPVVDYKRVAYVQNQNNDVEKKNQQLVKEGKKPLPLQELPIPAPLKIKVEVTVADAQGATLKAAGRELEIRRSQFVWENNSIGITDQVIPPWTPVRYQDGRVDVWNRGLQFNGLGLLEHLENDGLEQIKTMRLVAVKDGKEIEIVAGKPALARQVDAEAVLTGSGSGAGLSLAAETKIEFDGFVLSKLTIGPANAGQAATVDKLYWEVVLPASEASHYCTTSGGWTAVHAKTPDYWSSQITSSGVLIGDFVPISG